MKTLLSLLLFAFLAGATIGCAGGGATKPTNAGTTPGSYTVTVTGSSSLTVATTAVTCNRELSGDRSRETLKNLPMGIPLALALVNQLEDVDAIAIFSAGSRTIIT